MKEIKCRYQIYSPAGNDTSLVFGIEADIENRSLINDYILGTYSEGQKDKNGFVVEQVGFINENKLSPKLVMAGGEFCGNATRAAAWYYLNGSQGEINISVSGVKGTLKAGVNDSCEAWAQMPISEIKEMDTGFYLVKIEGIVHLVVKQEQAKFYLDSSKQKMEMCEEKLKAYASDLMDEYCLKTNPAAGVIFLEDTNNGKLKIHPCVYVKEHGSFYYETACGSGTIAAGMVQCFIEKHNIELPIVQPSGREIKAIIEYSNGKINKNKAIICGPIIIHQEVHKLNISVPEILLIKDVEEWKKFPNKEEVYKVYEELFMDESYNEKNYGKHCYTKNIENI